MAVMMFSSCHDEPDPSVPENPSEETVTILGEWIDDIGVANCFTATVLHSDGTCSTEFGVSWPDQFSSAYYKFDQEFSYNKDSYSIFGYSPLAQENVTQEFKINHLDQLTLIASDASTGESSPLSRVIDTYNLKVGESRLFESRDYNLDPYEYTSFDEGIASVDKNGRISANRRGVSFIKAHTTLGNAVIRVVVTDEGKIIDDYTKWIFKSVNEVEQAYGKNRSLLDDNDHGLVYAYFPIDPIVEYLWFDVKFQEVYWVQLGLRDYYHMIDVKKQFDRDYKFIGEDDKSYHYSAIYGETKCYIILKKEGGEILILANLDD